MLAGHELQRAVGAEVQHGVSAEILAQPAVERSEGVGRREALLEQQAHRVALVAEGGLHADEGVAEALAEHEKVAAVALVPARCCTPLPLDLAEPALLPHVPVRGDARRHVGVGAEAGRVAAGDPLAQGVGALGNLYVVARSAERAKRIVERRENREVGGGAGAARVRREVEQHDRDLARGARGAAERHELGDTGGEGRGTLRVRRHLAPPLAGCRFRPAAERHRPDRAVQLRDGDHHGGLDRGEAARVGLPLLQGLELDGMGGDVRHVEGGENLLGGARVVVGRAADEREAGERDHGVHCRASIAHEVARDRRAGVEAAGKGGEDAQVPRLQRRDDAVVVPGVAGEHVGPHHEQADRAGGAGEGRELVGPGDDAAPRARVIEAGLGILDRGCGAERAAQAATGAVGVAVHEQAHEAREVLLGRGEPALQGEEVGAGVLGGARDQAQQLGQLAQHPHLALAAAAGSALAAVAAEALEQGDDAGGLGAHVEPAEAREPHHLAGGEAAEHGVAALAPGGQRRQDGADMVVKEEHGGDHDVAAGDVGAAGFERRVVAAPLVRRVHHQLQARHVAAQGRLRAAERAGDVAVHRHDHDADGDHPDRRRVSGRNGLWHHTGSRR